MTTKREWLCSLEPPLAKPGRGRFSKAALAAIKQAEADGVVFDEPVTNSVPKPEPFSEIPNTESFMDFVAEALEVNPQ